MPNIVAKPLHVVAAVIRGADGKILIAKRPAHISQGGKWEFPGGKVEAGETRKAALKRELQEEIGIEVTHAQPLIQVHHQYVERLVHLDVWEVTGFTGEAHGKEGQDTQWVQPDDLSHFTFPAANHAIITAAQLPDQYLITPEPSDKAIFLSQLEVALQQGIKLVQFRAKSLSAQAYVEYATAATALVHRYAAKIVLNAPPIWLNAADGLHLTSQQVATLPQRPVYLQDKFLSASCHTAVELNQALHLNCDFMLLSPVQVTASHPSQAALGWANFQALATGINRPIYALGGLQTRDINTARWHGAQGIAAIRSLWPALV